MSIETLIKELIEALHENTDTLKALTGKTAGAASGKTTTTPSKGEDKAPAKAPAKPAGKTPTVAQMKKAATDFLEEAGENEDDYLARREFVVELASEFDAERFSDIAAKFRGDALEKLEAYNPDADEDPAPSRKRDDIT
ncbi:hypothetical protein LOKG_00012 [Loktanella phage pCB2051-A]|uniref:Uncharacterized protein n=1 Tax=Loktanella phage pCB2051-A TaxID=754044 RepID=M4QSX2_9CAUD|nr:hypothetical protein LOKG_00012 [Loktanella phage pCB2051-A]AGH31449.1 hypothetical protein LOKG_00012 [Loktanella phage pCB2051-A]